MATRSYPTHSLVIACALSGLAGLLPHSVLAQEDPWPFGGRTATRIGNTQTVGPQTPTISWSVQIHEWPEYIIRSSSVMDSAGRVFAGWPYGITAVDSATRSMIWTVEGLDSVYTPAVSGDRVFWTTTSQDRMFYCSDAATGEILWSVPSVSGYGFGSSPVVSDDGTVVYTSDRHADVYARRVSDGSEVWTESLSDRAYCSPALAWPSLLVTASGSSGEDLDGLDPADASRFWTFPTGRQLADYYPVIDGDRVYVGSGDRYLYAIDAATGQEIWKFWAENIIHCAVAVGHDGTVYVATSGNIGRLFAVSRDGDELWRYTCEGTGIYGEPLISSPPIVAGDGTIYLCSSEWTGSYYIGRVHALNPDGTELWTKVMPDQVWASPMLAPDGTLYVTCRDRFLYAIHDPPNPTIEIQGACPGNARLVINDATPGGRVAIVFARNRGNVTIPNGLPCEGTMLYLDPSVRVVTTLTADETGHAQVTGYLPRAACNGFIQAIDLSSCHQSNMVMVE